MAGLPSQRSSNVFPTVFSVFKAQVPFPIRRGALGARGRGAAEPGGAGPVCQWASPTLPPGWASPSHQKPPSNCPFR